MTAAQAFDLQARGPYSLEACARFLEGFSPVAPAPAEPGHTHWAFATDSGADAAGACLRPLDGGVAAEVFGSDDPAVRDQLVRILSLDADGDAFAAVGQRDAVVARLQERYAGLRPVLFFTPFEAAAWAIISHRVRMRQAAGVKARLTRELGCEIAVHGDRRFAFPQPARVLAARDLPGLSERKAANLRELAAAAVAGALDADRLRGVPVDVALAELKSLPGIGEFYAQLILVRGAGSCDVLPSADPRLVRAVALAYGIDAPDARGLAEIAEAWRPFRSWAAFLLRVFLEDETRELAG
jgi:DNA-3-methyladenine glycosylase II